MKHISRALITKMWVGCPCTKHVIEIVFNSEDSSGSRRYTSMKVWYQSWVNNFWNQYKICQQVRIKWRLLFIFKQKCLFKYLLIQPLLKLAEFPGNRNPGMGFYSYIMLYHIRVILGLSCQWLIERSEQRNSITKIHQMVMKPLSSDDP